MQLSSTYKRAKERRDNAHALRCCLLSLLPITSIIVTTMLTFRKHLYELFMVAYVDFLRKDLLCVERVMRLASYLRRCDAIRVYCDFLQPSFAQF